MGRLAGVLCSAKSDLAGLVFVIAGIWAVLCCGPVSKINNLKSSTKYIPVYDMDHAQGIPYRTLSSFLQGFWPVTRSDEAQASQGHEGPKVPKSRRKLHGGLSLRFATRIGVEGQCSRASRAWRPKSAHCLTNCRLKSHGRQNPERPGSVVPGVHKHMGVVLQGLLLTR